MSIRTIFWPWSLLEQLIKRPQQRALLSLKESDFFNAFNAIECTHVSLEELREAAMRSLHISSSSNVIGS
jgi:hypothetical protein